MDDNNAPLYAFPSFERNIMNGYSNETTAGMLLRDYIAIQLLPTTMTITLEMLKVAEADVAGEKLREAVCSDCYRWADLMIKVREKVSE